MNSANTIQAIPLDYANRVNELRRNRRSLVEKQRGAVQPLISGGKVILHLFPVACLTNQITYDIAAIRTTASDLQPLSTPNNCSYGFRYNRDGVATATFNGSDKAYVSYTQINRDGSIEVVDAEFLRPNPLLDLWPLPIIAFEELLLAYLPRCVHVIQEIGGQCPIIAALTLTNIENIQLTFPGPQFAGASQKFDEQFLELPTFLISSFNQDADVLLKTSIDTIWNSFGYAASPQYREGRFDAGINRSPTK